MKARAYGAMQEKTPAGVDLLESLRLAAAADDDLSVVRTWGCRASQVHFCANRCRILYTHTNSRPRSERGRRSAMAAIIACASKHPRGTHLESGRTQTLDRQTG